MTRGWFAQHPESDVLDAPVNSLDLNPIENFWAELTRDWVSAILKQPKMLPVVQQSRIDCISAAYIAMLPKNPIHSENVIVTCTELH